MFRHRHQFEMKIAIKRVTLFNMYAVHMGWNTSGLGDLRQIRVRYREYKILVIADRHGSEIEDPSRVIVRSRRPRFRRLDAAKPSNVEGAGWKITVVGERAPAAEDEQQ